MIGLKKKLKPHKYATVHLSLHKTNHFISICLIKTIKMQFLFKNEMEPKHAQYSELK